MPLYNKDNRRIKSLAKKIQKVTAERKHEDIEVSSSIASTGQIVQITRYINVGTGSQGRIGSDINVSSIMINYSVDVADTYNTVRVMVLQWMPDSNVMPLLVSYILDPAVATGTVSAANYYLVHYDRKEAQNYFILYDKTHNVDAANNSRISKQIIVNKFHTNVVNYTVDNASNNEQTGGLYLLAVSDSTAVSHPVLNALIRLNYYDS